MYTKLSISIISMFLLVNVVSAQDFTADVSISSDLDYFNEYVSTDSEVSNLSVDTKDIYFDVPAQVSQFNTQTKLFSIANGTTKYSQAELLDKAGNKTIKTVELAESNRSMDMSDVPSGSYYMILTNDSGEVHSEKIIIF